MASILMTGDLMCVPSMTEAVGENYGILYRYVTDRLHNCDFAVGNLETPIAGEDLKFTFERWSFNSPESYLSAVKSAGFGLLTLANNHCMDRGEEGIRRTLDACERVGIDAIGLNRREDDTGKIYVREIGGIRAAFLSFTYGTNAFSHHRFAERPWAINLIQPEETLTDSIFLLDPHERIRSETERLYPGGKAIPRVASYRERMKRDVENAKKQADFVVFLLHCGGQYNDEPDAFTESTVSFLKKCGADCVICNHAHNIQRFDAPEKGFATYSLGNFMGDPRRCDPSCQAPGGGAWIDPSYSAAVRLDLRRGNGEILPSYAVELYHLTVENGYPVVRNVADEANPDRATVRMLMNRITGKSEEWEVMERYDL